MKNEVSYLNENSKENLLKRKLLCKSHGQWSTKEYTHHLQFKFAKKKKKGKSELKLQVGKVDSQIENFLFSVE